MILKQSWEVFMIVTEPERDNPKDQSAVSILELMHREK